MWLDSSGLKPPHASASGPIGTGTRSAHAADSRKETDKMAIRAGSTLGHLSISITESAAGELPGTKQGHRAHLHKTSSRPELAQFGRCSVEHWYESKGTMREAAIEDNDGSFVKPVRLRYRS